MSFDEKMLLIRNYDLWSHITDDEYEELKIVHRYLETKKNDFVYFEAQHHNKLYFLKEGFIKVGYIDEQGREIIKEVLQKGEIFGQITLEKNNLNGEFAKAYKTDVSLCAFTIDDFEKLLAKKPELALKYSRQMGAKLRTLENRLQNLLRKDVKTRLLFFLGKLLQMQEGVETPKGYCISNYLTHEDIANLIGSSRQTVTTLLNELEAADLLQISRQQICFPDVKAFQKLVSVI